MSKPAHFTASVTVTGDMPHGFRHRVRRQVRGFRRIGGRATAVMPPRRRPIIHNGKKPSA